MLLGNDWIKTFCAKIVFTLASSGSDTKSEGNEVNGWLHEYIVKIFEVKSQKHDAGQFENVIGYPFIEFIAIIINKIDFIFSTFVSKVQRFEIFPLLSSIKYLHI